MQAYKINTFNQSSELATSIFNKYAPVLDGVHYEVQGQDLFEITTDWLHGRKLTSALVKERSVLVAAQKAAMPEAIAKTEAELATMGAPSG